MHLNYKMRFLFQLIRCELLPYYDLSPNPGHRPASQSPKIGEGRKELSLCFDSARRGHSITWIIPLPSHTAPRTRENFNCGVLPRRGRAKNRFEEKSPRPPGGVLGWGKCMLTGFLSIRQLGRSPPTPTP